MRIFSGVFIVIFLAMLSFPLIFVDLSSDRISVEENRKLANRPKLIDIKNHPGTFIRDFDTWYKDSIGFREYLLTLYNIIEKNRWLNDIRYIDGQYVYLVGDQGHHYFASVDGMLIPKFQGKPFLSDEQLSNMAAKLDEVKVFLTNKGIPLVVMFCTDKESIYPEFYPKSIIKSIDPIQLDMITMYLQEQTDVDVFNIKQALLAEKIAYPVYNMSFGDLTHYSEIGAFFAHRELMKHINIHFPQIVPYELDDIEICYSKKGIPSLSFKAEIKYKKLDMSFLDGVDLVLPFPQANISYENIDLDLPTILVFCDSYANEILLGKYIAQYFGKAIFIHYANMYQFEEFIALYKPDIVVFESAERELGGFANCVSGIPKLPLL